MKLKTFHVTEFQSVLDSRPVEVGDITCLVGKNEAGKTALLNALYRLNPIRDEDTSFSITDDYPRSEVSDYEHEVQAGTREHALVVHATFSLDDPEVVEVEAVFGSDFFTKKECSYKKKYANTTYYILHVNEKAAIEHLSRNLPPDILDQARGADNAKKLLEVLQTHPADPAVAAVLPVVTEAAPHSFSHYAWTKLLRKHVPKFLYFDEYYQMRGCENIQALQQRQASNTLKPSDQPLLGLIELARLDLPQLLNPQRTLDLKNKLEGAGNHLTRQILKFWSQNKHLQIRFDVRPALPQDPPDMRNGINIWGEVYDTHHLVSTGLGTRSRGFVWFFSFVAWYSQVKRRGENVILLLDEPGLTLHGRAQGDLLDYFETELKPAHQLIYTTHSPFMVHPAHFERVRIVQDRSIDQEDLPREQQGTKATTDIFEASDDSLFPLQGALGYDVHQSLFIGPNSLLVEGGSDLLYLRAVSAILERDGREGLSERWVLTPCGGASKVPTIVRLLTGQKGLNIATLVDIQDRDKEMVEGLYREKLMKKNNVLTFADFTGTKEADIEDMFEVEFYLELVNEEFKSALPTPITKAKLVSRAPRILARLETYLEGNPMSKGSFSHYRPARYFHEHATELAGKISEATKDRFEKTFQALNKLL